MAGFGDWFGQLTGFYQTSDSKAKTNTLNSIRDKYNQNSQKLQNLVQQNTGIQGQKKALQAGKNIAVDLANQAGNQAAQQARNAGMNATAAAALGAQSGASNYGNLAQQQQQSMYDAMGNEISGQKDILTANKESIDQARNAAQEQQTLDDKIGANYRGAIKGIVDVGAQLIPGGNWLSKGLEAVSNAFKNANKSE